MTQLIGVCSWSLAPTSPGDLVQALSQVGCSAVQLALDPIRVGAWDESGTLTQLRDAGITLGSGMMAMKDEDYSTLETIRTSGGVRPDATWNDNLEAARQNAALASRLGISLITFHAGFLPHDAADPERATMLDRLRQLHDVFHSQGVAVALETGQESAETLLTVLADLDRPIGVNFDPANMILYGMGDPVESLRALGRHVLQIHIKDANPTTTPGEWGSETPAGQGSVDWSAFFATLRDVAPDVPWMIEREAGDTRTADIATANQLAQQFAGSNS